MLRVSVVVDCQSPCRHLGNLLDALQRTRSIELASLVMPTGERREQLRGRSPWLSVARVIARLFLVLETHALLGAGSLSGRISRRTKLLQDTGQDLAGRFSEVVLLDADEKLQVSQHPDVVLILGNWIPEDLAELASDTRFVQVLFGGLPSRELMFAGFHESDAGMDQTPVKLYRLEAGSLSRHLIVDGRNRTKLLFSLNQAACWDRASSLLQTRLTCGFADLPHLAGGGRMVRILRTGDSRFDS